MRRPIAWFRVALYIGYGVLSFLISIVFAGAGHGSYAPPPILFSWGWLPWTLTVHAWPGYGTITFFLGPVLYLTALHYLALNRAFAVPRAAIPLIHVGGAALALQCVEHGQLVTQPMITASVVVALCASVGFLAADYWLIGRLTRVEPPNSAYLDSSRKPSGDELAPR